MITVTKFGSGNLFLLERKVAKEIKEKLIKAYEAKVQVRRDEINQGNIDVNNMLGKIEDLHMGPMELAQEVSMDNETSNIDIEVYPYVVLALCPTLTPTSTTQVINCRDSI